MGAAKEIATRKYNYVVLHEQSTLAVKNPLRMAENVRLFVEIIRASGSETVLYMTWARQNVPESQKAITDACNAIGKEISAFVAPLVQSGADSWPNMTDPCYTIAKRAIRRQPVRILLHAYS